MILFLYGTDAVRSARKLGELKAKFKVEHDASGMNLAVIDAAKASVGDLQQALLASPFMSDRRMVVVRGLLVKKKDEQEPMVEVLEQIPASTIAVFYEVAEATACKKSPLFKLLTAGKYHWEFAPLIGAQLSGWLQKEAQEKGVAFAPMALAAFTAAVGSDLARATQETAKLAAYIGEQKLITPESVALLVSGEVHENMFGFLDAVANRASIQAAKLLDEQIAAGTEPMQLLAMIARTVRLLIQSRDLIDRNVPEAEALRVLGVHPFAAKKSLQQARRFDMPTLINLHTRLLDVDRKIKTGLAPNPRVMLDLLVAKAVV